MTIPFAPIFGLTEQVAYHSLEITDILAQVMEASTSPRESEARMELFKERSYGRFRYEDDASKIVLTCDLNRQTKDKSGRTIVLADGNQWLEVQQEALAMLDDLSTLQRPADNWTGSSAQMILADLAWYLEQRRWVLNAQENPRSNNHWVRATPRDMRLLLGLRRTRELVKTGPVPLDLLVTMLPSESAAEMAREISRAAKIQGQSLMQFVDDQDDLPDIISKDGSVLRVSAKCVKDRMIVNLAGQLTGGVNFNQDIDWIIIDNRYSESAIDGLIASAVGRPVKEIIDLPWQDDSDIVVGMESAEGLIVIKKGDIGQEPRNLVTISQVLPPEARPSKE